MVRDRGQLLLIGAILIGMTIIGTVVMLNGMEYADTAGSQGQAQVLDDAERTEEMVERDMERLLRQVDANSPAKYEEAVIQNVSAYNNHSRNMTVTQGSAVVNVSVNESQSDGTRIHQRSSSPNNEKFQATDPSGPGNPNQWTLASDVEKVAGFRLNVTRIDGTGSSKFTVRITNDTNYKWEMRVYQTGGGSAFEVRSGDSSSLPTWTGTPDCTSSDEEINFHLLQGTATDTDSDCEFTSFRDESSPPYDIEFDNGNRARGTYTIFISGKASGNVDSSDTRSYVVNPAIDFQYRSSELEYNRTMLIETEESP